MNEQLDKLNKQLNDTNLTNSNSPIIHRFAHEGDADSIIIYIEGLLEESEIKFMTDYLDSMEDFERGASYYGQIRRLQKWYQESGHYFSKSWKNQDHERWVSKSYDDDLPKIQTYMQVRANEIIDFYNDSKNANNSQNVNKNESKTTLDHVRFNSCLINKYRDTKDSIRHHRDTPTSFGEYPTICGLSIGTERMIEFKRVLYDATNPSKLKDDSENSKDNFSINLKSGSILIMAGSSQKYFSHAIPPRANPIIESMRYSLTFREYLI